MLRTCAPGHLTASAWILAADGRHCLLAHHRKLGKWLQLGGHADGEPELWRVALREAQEESGMRDFAVGRTVLDLDLHPIPARGAEAEHLHFDVRFLLRAAPDQSLVCSDESNEVRWVEVGDLPRYTTEESVLRLARKARAGGLDDS
ncbi:MAG: NUDIX hydrolase [Planctomycetes bacterium]|nr:NUDIX hydrolase [Planctomycetota bacterium]MCB9868590.1 NUDIX hydrolase [Planctomycetota bacterium]